MLLGPQAPAPAADAAVDLCRRSSLHLDTWQELVLRRMLGEVPDTRPGSPNPTRWAASQVLLIVPRQNGKTAILEARELVGLFVLGERLIIHSAQELATGLESMRRLAAVIDSSAELRSRVRNVFTSNGKEGIELHSGQRLLYRARSKNSIRGLSPDLLVGDEAYEYSEQAQAAQQFATSAQWNPQTVLASSAVDQERHDHGHVLARARRSALRGDPAIVLAEWSASIASIDEAQDERVASDPAHWEEANPALDIRIDRETVAREQRSMDPRSFAVERLGIGDWPDPAADASQKVSPAAWATLHDPRSKPLEPVTIAFDVSPDRQRAAVCLAGRRTDGLLHVEILDHLPRTAWVLDRIVGLVERNEVREVICDGMGPAMSLVAPLADRGVEVHTTSGRELASACGGLVDLVQEKAFRHRDDDGWLEKALRGAATKPLGDAWAWRRKSSTTDISPLVAATLALHVENGGQQPPPPAKKKRGLADRPVSDFAITSIG